MNILYLPLKKEWYEMIEAEIKKEEYREFKPYWLQRLMLWADGERIDKISAERVMEHPIGTFEWGRNSKTMTPCASPTATRSARCFGSARASRSAKAARNGVHPITKHSLSNLGTN